MNKMDSLVQDIIQWSDVISNVVISQQYITEQWVVLQTVIKNIDEISKI